MIQDPDQKDSEFEDFLKKLATQPNQTAPTEENTTQADQTMPEPETSPTEDLRSLFSEHEVGDESVEPEKYAGQTREADQPTNSDSVDGLDDFLHGLGQTASAHHIPAEPSEDNQIDDRLAQLRQAISEDLPQEPPNNAASQTYNAEPGQQGTQQLRSTLPDQDLPQPTNELTGEPQTELPHPPTQEPSTGSPNQIFETSEEDRWENVENRLADLQKNFQVDISDSDKRSQKASLLEVLTDDNPTKHTAGKLVYSMLAVIILVLLGVILYLLFKPTPEPPAAPISGNAPLNQPYPLSLSIDGQTIELTQTEVDDTGLASMEAPAWVRGSEVTRLIYFPAKTHINLASLATGSPIQLQFSNGDIQTYYLTSSKASDLAEFLTLGEQPNQSLAIGMAGEDDLALQVYLAELAP